MKVGFSEHDEQKGVITWANLMAARHPELSLLYAVPNGGQRHLVVAKKLKAEGAKAGVPDLCLPVARGGYYGMYIELKKQHGGRLQPSQKWWIEKLNEQGYLAVVCHGAQQAIKQLMEYLDV